MGVQLYVENGLTRIFLKVNLKKTSIALVKTFSEIVRGRSFNKNI
jgi:hypothetical protein